MVGVVSLKRIWLGKYLESKKCGLLGHILICAKYVTLYFLQILIILIYSGGGNTSNPKLNQTRPPLRWMVFEAAPLGLRTSQFNRDLLDEELVNIQESLTGLWWFLEYIPIRRLTYSRPKDAQETTWR